MKLRMPSVPLITVDPYFSIWSNEPFNNTTTLHWTQKPNTIIGTIFIDGEPLRFLGNAPNDNKEEAVIPFVSVDCDALTTTAIFADSRIELTAKFTTPLLIDSLYYSSRPVSYLKLSYKALDGKAHNVEVKISCSEELALSLKGEGRVLSEKLNINGNSAIKMGKGNAKILGSFGDSVRIDWGNFYLATKGQSQISTEVFDDMYMVYAKAPLSPDALFTFAYDDIDSLIYFEKPIKAYWKKDGKTIEDAICEAINEYDSLLVKCTEFSRSMENIATQKGGKKYAELLVLSYRQIMAGHKLCIDDNGEIIYISKECSSNGCAATVDISYPSAPLYLYYNTELLKGMLRPVFRYANSGKWPFDFAPHDLGTYPILNGNIYGGNKLEKQMPVEECGNMIILMAAICDNDKNADFAKPYLPLLEQWKEYLLRYGLDPGDQLCTDDFAGCLSRNCNLAIKAIMGIAGYAKIQWYLGNKETAESLFETARKYAASWCENARDEQGGYRLAFDKPNTFSLKYNAVWDIVWGTNIFPKEMFKNEIARYKKEMLAFGVPLDSREKYAKSDWLVWAACLTDNQDDFEYFIEKLWNAYNTTESRVPMTDFYYADTSVRIGFFNRTVLGAFFIKLLF